MRANARPKPIIGSAGRRNAIWIRLRQEKGVPRSEAPPGTTSLKWLREEKLEKKPPHGSIHHARGVPRRSLAPLIAAYSAKLSA